MLVIANLSMRRRIEHKIRAHTENRNNIFDAYRGIGGFPTVVIVVIADDDGESSIQLECGHRIRDSRSIGLGGLSTEFERLIPDGVIFWNTLKFSSTRLKDNLPKLSAKGIGKGLR